VIGGPEPFRPTGRRFSYTKKESVMKLIIAIIRPEKLEAVQEALGEREVNLMTVSNVHGCGSQRGYTETFSRREDPGAATAQTEAGDRGE
jgi:hypothetical protein